MKLELTQELIDQLEPPQEGELIVWDTRVHGLFLKVTAKGKKGYGLYFRYGNVQRRPKLGDVREISLEDARKLAGELLLKGKRAKLGLE